MTQGRLTAAQVAILRALAGVIPRWRLCGGAALAGFHTQHRGTRDLDLLWQAADLEPLGDQVERSLAAAGLVADVVQRAPAFRRYRVKSGDEIVVLDVIAEPTPAIAAPVELTLDDERILVDAPHELLVAKLSALLGRSELRDLEDVRALLASGGDLERALADAPRKDAGFSPPTLAWVLEQFPIEPLATTLGRRATQVEELRRFRDELVRALLSATRPE